MTRNAAGFAALVEGGDGLQRQAAVVVQFIAERHDAFSRRLAKQQIARGRGGGGIRPEDR